MGNIETSFATKYRPTTFGEVVGQDTTVNILKKFAADKTGVPVRSIFLKGSWGSGKCIRGTQRISTGSGYVRIKDLVHDAKEGFTDFIMPVEQPDGSFCNTSHFYKESNADLFVLQLRSGAVVTGTPEHPIMSAFRHRSSPMELIKVGALSVGDFIVKQRATSLLDILPKENGLSEYMRFYEMHGSTEDTSEVLISKSASFMYLWGLLSKYSILCNIAESKFHSILVQHNDLELVKDILEYLRIFYNVSGDGLVIDEYGTKLLTESFDTLTNKFKYLGKCFKYHQICHTPEFTSEFIEDEIISVEHVKEEVYDVSVPDTHLFMSCGVINHNTTLARIFAKAVNCKEFPETGEVCGKCDGCLDASSKNSRLYYEFDSSAVGNVETIRNFPTMFGYKPNGTRVVVLDECHAVSNAAATALLKIIEDGIPDTIFVFCSTEDILPTLKSRSVVLSINPIPIDSIMERVRFVADKEGIQISDEDLSVLAVKSGGHMRDALSILQLYSVAGSHAVDSSIRSLQYFIVDATSARKDRERLIPEILKYPIVDIVNSIRLIVKNSFSLSHNDKFYAYVRQRRIHELLFRLINPDSARNAMKDEVGVEILLNYIYEELGHATKI